MPYLLSTRPPTGWYMLRKERAMFDREKTYFYFNIFKKINVISIP